MRVKKSETPFWFECDLSLIYCTSAQFAAALCFFTSFDRMTRVLFPKLGKVLNRRAGGDLASDMNVVEPILFQARNDPPAPALCVRELPSASSATRGSRGLYTALVAAPFVCALRQTRW
jgi:hypothetical protein